MKKDIILEEYTRMQTLAGVLNESEQSDVDFAHAVANILKSEYGSHLYGKFIDELKSKMSDL